MRPMKRAVHIDFHTMPGIHDFNREWDPAIFAQTLQDAGVTYINAFARCNIGFAYYPTRIGIPYPGLKGDMFGDLLRECHRRDIGVSAYINVGLDHEQSARHMGWLRLDQEGRVIRGDRTGNFFRELCYNNPEYRAYHFGMLKEIIAYDPDGYFFDCMVTEPCHCYYCLKKMRTQGIDPLDRAASLRFQEQSMLDFAAESLDLIGQGKYFYLNGLPYAAAQGMDTHCEVECLPSGWGYDYFWPHAAYARNIQKTVLYMTGRFQTNWGDFGGFKAPASLENDYFDALCAGVGVSVGDHQHPARNLDPGIYRVVGRLNERIRALEPYTEKARFLADIGVLANARRTYEPGEDNNGLTAGHAGLARLFGELRQSYDIINETMPFDQYRVLVLPDRLTMTESLQARLAAYLRQGGRILASGTAGLNPAQNGFALPEWDMDFVGMNPDNVSYFRLADASDPQLIDMDYNTGNAGGILFRGDQRGARLLARSVRAYSSRHWDGFHGYFYTPPEGPTAFAAAAVNATGNVAQIAFAAFTAYEGSSACAIKALVRQCLARLLPEPLLLANGLPSTARVTATGCTEYTLLHIKVTYPEIRGRMGIIEEHNIQEAGAAIDIRGRFTSARTLPEQEPAAVEDLGNGYTRIRLPRIVGYQMIQLMPGTD